jgi:hypothetical protein
VVITALKGKNLSNIVYSGVADEIYVHGNGLTLLGSYISGSYLDGSTLATDGYISIGGGLSIGDTITLTLDGVSYSIYVCTDISSTVYISDNLDLFDDIDLTEPVGITYDTTEALSITDSASVVVYNEEEIGEYESLSITEETSYSVESLYVNNSSLSITENVYFGYEEILNASDSLNYSESTDYRIEITYLVSEQITYIENTYSFIEPLYIKDEQITLSETCVYFLDPFVTNEDNVALSSTTSEVFDNTLTVSEASNITEICTNIIGKLALTTTYLFNEDESQALFQDSSIVLIPLVYDVFDYIEVTETLSLSENVSYEIDAGASAIDTIAFIENAFAIDEFAVTANVDYLTYSENVIFESDPDENEVSTIDYIIFSEKTAIVSEYSLSAVDNVSITTAYTEWGLGANSKIFIKDFCSNSYIADAVGRYYRAYDIITTTAFNGGINGHVKTEEDEEVYTGSTLGYPTEEAFLSSIATGAEGDFVEHFIPVRSKGYQLRAKLAFIGKELEVDYIGVVYKQGRIK